MFRVSLLATAKQKQMGDAQNVRREEFKHVTENAHVPKKDGEGGAAGGQR